MRAAGLWAVLKLLLTATQEITTYRSRFPKPLEQYQLLTFFGENIVAVEGDEWKRYRKITAPAFSEVRGG